MWNRNLQSVAILTAVLSCAIAPSNRALAQDKKPLAVDDALRTKQFAPLSPLALSPDGKQCAYSIQDNGRARSYAFSNYRRTGVPPWGIGADIWIEDIGTGATRNLTEGRGNSWLPTWSPDGRYLAFVSDREPSGLARLWVWDVRRNKLREASDASVRTNQIEWAEDSQTVLLTVRPDTKPQAEDVRDLPAGSGKGTGRSGEQNRPTVILYQSDSKHEGSQAPSTADPWDLDESLRDLVTIRVETGQVRTLVHYTRITTFSASPDGTEIGYTIPRRFERPGSQQILFDLDLVGSDGSHARTLSSDIRLDFEAGFRWSRDSSHITYREGGPGRVGNCFVVAIAGGAKQNVTQLAETESDIPSGPATPVWNDDGKSIFFIHHGELWSAQAGQAKGRRVGVVPDRQIVGLISTPDGVLWTSKDGTSTVVVTHDDAGKQDGFYRLDLRSGESARLLEQGQCYTCSRMSLDLAVSRNGEQAFYFREDAQHAPELWMSNRAFDSHRQLTHLHAQLEKYQMGSARLIHWLSDDGRPLEGVLLLPAGYKEGMRYPLVSWVYGGQSQSNDFDHFGLVAPGPFNMQLFATRGYAVFLPDIPLSLGTPIADITKAVLSGINKVVEMGIADPGRLGVMGHSFGGYSTLSLIVETKRFKAAVESGGFGDTIGEYGAMGPGGTAFGISVEEGGQGSLGGTPWQRRDRYIENSPVLYLDRVECPLLIVHGSKDQTVGSFLADELFVDLRRLGKKVEYAKYVGEDHSPVNWDYANQADFCNRFIAWFEDHLK